MSSIGDVDHDRDLELEPPLNLHLTRVGSLFLPESETDRSSISTTAESTYGSLASVGRFCNDADDIVYQDAPIPEGPVESTQWQLAGTTTVADGVSRTSPVYVPWVLSKSRCVEIDDEKPCLDEVIDKQIIARRVGNVGSSLAPQSSNASTASSTPSIVQARRPRYDANPPPIVPSMVMANTAQNRVSTTDRRVTQVILHQPQFTNSRQSGADLLRCGECGKAFQRRSDLIHHTRYHIRSSDRPYKCDQCGHGFLHKKDLDRHMPRHTGQKLFRCSVPGCPKTYTRKDNLSRHIRHDHATGTSLIPAPVAEELSAADSADELSDVSVGQPVVRRSTQLSTEDSAPDTDEVETPNASDGYQQIGSNGPSSVNLGKRPADDEPSSGRGNDIRSAKRPPRKSPLKHRLACPYRKCKPLQFSSQPRYKVCATTPHEYMRRVVDHMDRNHQISVCGRCFLAFSSVEYLRKHKDTCEHCGKCYLPFLSREALVAHGPNCKPVESSGSQEDVWQIMYETLCGDGARHDPSFDNDQLVDEPIPPNNLARMRFLDEQFPLPGQVDPLRDEVKSHSGNVSAPSTMKSDSGDRKPVTAVVGARKSSLPTSGPSRNVQHLQTEVRHLQVQDRISQRPIAMTRGPVMTSRQPALYRRDDYSISNNSIFPSATIVHRFVDEAFAEDENVMFEGLGLSNVAPGSSIAAAVDKSSIFRKLTLPSFFDMKPFQSALPQTYQDFKCPSLTSENTATTIDQLEDLLNTSSYPTTSGGENPNNSIKEKVQSYHLTWNLSPSIVQQSNTVEVTELESELDVREIHSPDQEPHCIECGAGRSFRNDGFCLKCHSPWHTLDPT